MMSITRIELPSCILSFMSIARVVNRHFYFSLPFSLSILYHWILFTEAHHFLHPQEFPISKVAISRIWQFTVGCEAVAYRYRTNIAEVNK